MTAENEKSSFARITLIVLAASAGIAIGLLSPVAIYTAKKSERCEARPTFICAGVLHRVAESTFRCIPKGSANGR